MRWGVARCRSRSSSTAARDRMRLGEAKRGHGQVALGWNAALLQCRMQASGLLFVPPRPVRRTQGPLAIHCRAINSNAGQRP